MPLFWARNPRETNFGDELTALIIPALTGLPVHWSPLNRRCLIGAGSVLGWLDGGTTQASRVIWGAGLMVEESTALLHNDLLLRVRGKLTLERIAEKSSRHFSSSSWLDSVGLGDPGLITSLAFPHKRPECPSTILFIPHYVDRYSQDLQQLVYANPDIKVLDVAEDPRILCAEISQARIVLSSALHPLIVADSYGVPNVRVKLSDRVGGGDFKFRDYYSVFDSPPVTHAIDMHTLSSSLGSQLTEIVDQYERRGITLIMTRLSDSLPDALRLVGSLGH